MTTLYLPLFIMFAVALLVCLGMFSLGQFVGPKNPTPEKMTPFECGNDTSGAKGTKMSVKFYLTAILFVVFDIEVVFLYPWAVEFKSLGWDGLCHDAGVHLRADRGARLLLEKGSSRMGEMKSTTTHVLEAGEGQGFATTRFQDLLGWAQKYSLFMYPFVTACCGMEFMAVTSPRHDLSRFGAEAPRFSPRQSDLLWVVGTISQRQAPVLKRIYEQMAEPKWVMAFGTCASCGGFYDNYTTVAGIDKIIPCDVYNTGLSTPPGSRL